MPFAAAFHNILPHKCGLQADFFIRSGHICLFFARLRKNLGIDFCKVILYN